MQEWVWVCNMYIYQKWDLMYAWLKIVLALQLQDLRIKIPLFSFSNENNNKNNFFQMLIMNLYFYYTGDDESNCQPIKEGMSYQLNCDSLAFK